MPEHASSAIAHSSSNFCESRILPASELTVSSKSSKTTSQLSETSLGTLPSTQLTCHVLPTFRTLLTHSRIETSLPRSLGGQFFKTAQYAPPFNSSDMHRANTSGGHLGT